MPMGSLSSTNHPQIVYNMEHSLFFGSLKQFQIFGHKITLKCHYIKVK